MFPIIDSFNPVPATAAAAAGSPGDATMLASAAAPDGTSSSFTGKLGATFEGREGGAGLGAAATTVIPVPLSDTPTGQQSVSPQPAPAGAETSSVGNACATWEGVEDGTGLGVAPVTGGAPSTLGPILPSICRTTPVVAAAVTAVLRTARTAAPFSASTDATEISWGVSGAPGQTAGKGPTAPVPTPLLRQVHQNNGRHSGLPAPFPALPVLSAAQPPPMAADEALASALGPALAMMDLGISKGDANSKADCSREASHRQAQSLIASALAAAVVKTQAAAAAAATAATPPGTGTAAVGHAVESQGGEESPTRVGSPPPEGRVEGGKSCDFVMGRALAKIRKSPG